MQTSIKALILCVILCISLVTALQFGCIYFFRSNHSCTYGYDDGPKCHHDHDKHNYYRYSVCPRLIYSVLTGIGLSLVGLLMQTVTRNALGRSLCIRCFIRC